MDCEVDTFQDAVAPHGISECIPCHGDTMTVGTGSTSMADCLPGKLCLSHTYTLRCQSVGWLVVAMPQLAVVISWYIFSQYLL